MKTTLPLPALLRRYLLSLLALLPLAAAATGPVLTLQGTGGTGTDVTAFVDQVEIVNAATGAVVAGALANAGFEAPSQAGVASGYSYAPGGGAWTFSPQAGIARNGSAFGNPAAPEGSQVALLQYTGSIQQTMVLGAGTYQVRLLLAQRSCCGNQDQAVVVKVDNVVLSIVSASPNTTAGFTLPPFTVFGVATLSPAANARAAARSTPVGVSFSTPVDAATAGNVKVFSAQYRGRRTATAGTSGNTVTLTPTASSGAASFRPGETVRVSVPATVHSTGGAAAVPYVYQFTTAVSGPGIGNFQVPAANADPAVGNSPQSVAVGDVDSDGDLDMLTANSGSSTVSVRLNNGSGSFSAPATNPNPAVGSGPGSVVLGDVDGDGDLDMLTANANDNTVSVRLNNGTGNFTPPATNPNPAVGSSPGSLALGDVDGDGDLDLLTANFGGNTVSVRLNDGTGNFTAPATNANPAVGSGPLSVTLGDVDGDGDLDLLTANFGGGTMSVRLNDGTGNFTGGSDSAVGTAPYSVAVGDVDGDGDLDVLTANSGSNTVSVRLNNGTGSFTAPAINPNPAVGSTPYSVALSDVDADGDLDVVTANHGGNTVSVRLNDGTGNFTAPATNANPAVGSYPTSVALGDVDGDGDLDVLTANSADNTVSVRLNQPPAPAITSASPTSGVAGTSVTLTGTALSGATAVTVNGVAATFTGVSATSLSFLVPAGASATPGIIVTTPGGMSAAYTGFPVLLQVASTSPAANAHTAPPANSALALTFTEPVAAASIVPTATAGIHVFSAQEGGRKAGSFTSSGATVSYTSSLPAARHDFKPGEVVSVSVPATVQSVGRLAASKRVYQFTTAVGGTGKGNFRAPATNANLSVSGNTSDVAVGDVDSDGDLDLLATDYLSNIVNVWLNDGTGSFPTPATSLAVGAYPYSIALGDVDGDGDLDVFTANRDGNSVSMRLNDGTGNFTGGTNSGVGGHPVSVAVGDVDGDGDLDMLTANFNDNTVSVRLNDGTGNFTAPATNPNPAVGYSPQSVALGDVDGDGDLDLLTANFYNGSVSVRLNDGTGSFTAPATNPDPAVGNNPGRVAVGDVDGDGDLDLLTANYSDNTVSVRLNDGTGNFTAPATNSSLAVGSRPQIVALGDVDGDGDLDLLTANYGDDTVSVRLNDGTGSFTPPATNPNPSTGSRPYSLVMGDVDGDGDVDLLTANLGHTVSVRLNQPPLPVLSSLSASSAAAGGALTLSGTFLGGTTLATFTNTSTGAATTVAASAFTNTGYAATPQTIGLLVPGLAAGSYTVSVTTPNGTSNALPLTIRLQVVGLNPAANARAAVLSTTVGVTFSEPIDAATAGNIKVFSAQYRGRRTATASTSGNTVALTPTASSGAATFQPGETVRVSVPATVHSTGGAAAVPYVYQFTTAVGGTGRGNFLAPAPNANPAVGSNPFSVAVGDVDGDGDLDMLTANSADNTVSVRLNDGAGSFTAPATTPNPAVGNDPKSLVLGDVDGDGDLDLLAANSSTNTVSVRLNDGTGNFTAPATNANPTVGGAPLSVALGDVDGDGDLDMLTANSADNTVSVRLNDGAGSFTAPATNANLTVGSNPQGVALGDLDGDSDLDLLVANAGSNTVSVRLNDGTGNFTTPATNPNAAVGGSPTSVALGDVDGDGDLDMLTANGSFSSPGTVSVRLNDGTGNFTAPAANANPAVGNYPQNLALGDVDGDGDLDVLTTNRGDNTVSVRLNDGTGNFTAPLANATPAVGNSPSSVALGDVDGDGDLDLLTANYGGNTVSVRLNQPPAPVLSSLSASSVAPGGALTLSGTFLAGTTVATFTNTSTGAATTVAAAAFTSTGYAATPQTIGLLVPAGLAAGSYTVSVTTPNGTSNALPLTVCVLTVAVQNVSVPLGASGTVSVPASAFNNGSTSTCGPVTAQVSSQGTLTDQVNENGLLTLTAPTGAVFTAVTFASYGTPTYANGTYALGSCHAPSSQSVVEAVALGQHTFSISAENVVFGGDPCPNTLKQLVVQATYTNAPAAQLTYSCNSVGTFPVLVTLTDANGTSQQAPATVTVTVPAATSTTWTGTASTDWTDCQNWSYGRLPSATIDAVVPGGLANYPVLASGTGAVQSLLVASGASLTVNPGATLEVTGDFTTNGPVSLAGTVRLSGSAPVQALSSPAAFSTLLVDKAAGTVVLQRNLAVGTALTLTSGTLATGSFRVVLDPAATLTESNTAYVTGTVATTRPLTAGTAESFGGLGLTLTPATGSTSPGSTAVVRTTGTALSGAGTSQSILRYFDIQPATNAGLNVTLDFSYLDHERNGIAAASVALFKSTTGVGGPWLPQSPITLNGNTVRKTSISDFSVWTLGSAANPLPVELVDFTAEAQGTTALLRWTTASEHNSAHFEVEASADGTAFGRIGTVAAQGSSLTAHAYRFVDAQLAGYGSPQVYYRLRQVDLDGSFAYSPVRVVAVGSSSQAGFQVYPTLRAAGEPLRYVLAGALASQATGAELTVYTTTGQQVSAQHLAAGATGLVALPPLPTGWYLVRLRTADGTAFSARFGVQ